VAVSYAALSKELAADNTPRYVLQTTVEELTAAPEFVVVESNPAGGAVSAPAADDAMAPADPTTPAPADPMAPASSAQ
jgi:hypothetical protein